MRESRTKSKAWLLPRRATFLLPLIDMSSSFQLTFPAAGMQVTDEHVRYLQGLTRLTSLRFSAFEASPFGCSPCT